MRVPVGYASDRIAADLMVLPDSIRTAWTPVKVKKATTLAAMAKAHGMTSTQLRWYNPKLKPTKSGTLPVGRVVLVPSPAVVAAAYDVPDPAIERYGRGRRHVVRRGEGERLRIGISGQRAEHRLRAGHVPESLRGRNNAPSRRFTADHHRRHDGRSVRLVQQHSDERDRGDDSGDHGARDSDRAEVRPDRVRVLPAEQDEGHHLQHVGDDGAPDGDVQDHVTGAFDHVIDQDQRHQPDDGAHHE